MKTKQEVAVLALDIGGANIKAADGEGWSWSEPFALWRLHERLQEVLHSVIVRCPSLRLVATMTGEIADCYPSRRVGVECIIRALRQVSSGRELGIYHLGGTICSAEVAQEQPLQVAASNWHAMARLAAFYTIQASAMVVDIGSTTTDIVVIKDRLPFPQAYTDVDRMACGELVYTGVERTPVATTLQEAQWQGKLRPLASELYATSLDVWLTLGMLKEREQHVDTRETADGRPVTQNHARMRLARMFLADTEDFSTKDAIEFANQCATAQSRQVAFAIQKVSSVLGGEPEEIVLSGHGECLARRAISRLGWSSKLISLRDVLGESLARAAPAHAVAMIARGDLA